jgi:hypothetical protein
MDLHPDFKDLLSALADTSAEYLVVGGWAVGYHAEPRFTNDLVAAKRAAGRERDQRDLKPEAARRKKRGA